MAEVTPIRPDLPVREDTLLLQYRDSRDLHDHLVLSAVCAAIQLIDICNQKDLAADVLRLARDRLEAALEVARV
jgi:hypothetical protein